MIAVGMQADVVVLDTDINKLRSLDSLYLGGVRTLHSNRLTLEEEVLDADVVIGTVLVPGASAPKLVTEDMVRAMKRRAVLVDVAIDQGGCFATSRETTHTDPVYLIHDVVHCTVGNIPGAVPNTSTYALTNATLRYAVSLANDGVSGAVDKHPELVGGINVVGESVCHPAVAESLGVAHVPAERHSPRFEPRRSDTAGGRRRIPLGSRRWRGLSINTIEAYRRDLAQYLDFLEGPSQTNWRWSATCPTCGARSWLHPPWESSPRSGVCTGSS